MILLKEISCSYIPSHIKIKGWRDQHSWNQFKEDIGRYMWRHYYRPGMSGWAQVNGLRGNTSIHDRISYDLYYLENWSLAFDFKILARTFFSRKNAY